MLPISQEGQLCPEGGAGRAGLRTGDRLTGPPPPRPMFSIVISAGKLLGTSGTMFVEVEGIHGLHEQLASKVQIVMPFVTQWYGMMELRSPIPMDI